jgi:hypothetical protein
MADQQGTSPAAITKDAETTWVRRENLRLFLERLAALIGCRFTEDDWDAVRFGVEDALPRDGAWYEYPLYGRITVQLAFAGMEHAERIHVRVEAPEPDLAHVLAMVRIMQCYSPRDESNDLEILAEVAFIDERPPADRRVTACSDAHFAVCTECQEAEAFYGGRHWRDMLSDRERLPQGFAGLGFLTPEARRFFFPAYLVRGLRDTEGTLIAEALDSVKDAAWSPLQSQLIAFALYLADWTEPMHETDLP